MEENKQKITQQDQRSSRIQVRVKGAFILGGDFTAKPRKRKGPKKRDSRTYNNKLRRIKAKYNRLSKGSKFKTKYPTFDDFIVKNPLKQPTK
jgi:hypothetical protein